jgi:hypothetical protein
MSLIIACGPSNISSSSLEENEGGMLVGEGREQTA